MQNLTSTLSGDGKSRPRSVWQSPFVARIFVACVVVLASCSSGGEQQASEPDDTSAVTIATGNDSAETADCTDTRQSFRTDVSSSGNRFSGASLDLNAATPVDVELPEEPVWVVPYGDDQSWYVALASGDAVVVDEEAGVRSIPAVDGPPEIFFDAAGELEVVSVYDQHGLFDNPLPDAVVVQEGSVLAALVDPTDRYAHDVLGDELEAGAVQLLDLCSGQKTTIEVEAPDVIEGVSPMLADVDGDDDLDVVVTVSNATGGARLVVYELDGSLLAESDPIGQGNRWRNQLAVAPVGPEGEIEIIDVRVPHIGGVVEYFRVDGSDLVLQTSTQEYTSHVIGTRNLDMGLVADVAGGGESEVVVLTQRRDQVVALYRTEQGVEVAAEVDAGGRVVTNIALSDARNAALAVGTDNNTLRVWR